MKDDTKQRIAKGTAKYIIPEFIDLHNFTEVGDIGFVVATVESAHLGTWEQFTIWKMYVRPAHQRNIPRLYGSCGQSEGVERIAFGMARVTEVLKNGRARIVPIYKHEILEALATMGYPELADQAVHAPEAPEAPEMDHGLLGGGKMCAICGTLRRNHAPSAASHAFHAVQPSDTCKDCGKPYSNHNVRHNFVPQNLQKDGAR